MLKTITYSVPLAGLPGDFLPFRIVHLSDLHGRIFGKHNSILMDAVRSLSPDLIVMTGDMAEPGRGKSDKNGRQAFLKLCRSLVSLCPVYYSLGNHESEMPSDHLASWLKKVRRTGVLALDNQRADFIHDGVVFPVFGLTIPLLYYKDPLRKPYDRHACWTAQDMEKVFGSVPKNGAENFGPSILLAHNPLYFPAYRDWGAELTLAGHIHGGIIRLPFLGGVLSPDLTLFPKYDGGHFSEGSLGLTGSQKKHMIVSRGLSNTFLKRVLNPMELVCTIISPDTANSSILK